MGGETYGKESAILPLVLKAPRMESKLWFTREILGRMLVTSLYLSNSNVLAQKLNASHSFIHLFFSDKVF